MFFIHIGLIFVFQGMSDAIDKIPRVNLLPVSTPAACSNSPVTPPLTPLLSETVQITDTTSTAANQPISKFLSSLPALKRKCHCITILYTLGQNSNRIQIHGRKYC